MLSVVKEPDDRIGYDVGSVTFIATQVEAVFGTPALQLAAVPKSCGVPELPPTQSSSWAWADGMPASANTADMAKRTILAGFDFGFIRQVWFWIKWIFRVKLDGGLGDFRNHWF
jgi:hypothetical protein